LIQTLQHIIIFLMKILMS